MTLNRYILVLATLVLLCGTTPSAERGMGVGVESAAQLGIEDYNTVRHHALVIAINDYKYWPDLGSALNDGKAIAATLKKQFAFGDVKLLANEHASREAILEALDSYLSLGGEDSLIIYYAGHGWMDPAVKTGYWVPAEARKDKKFDYVANSQIVEDYFKKYRVKHLLVMADSCFSGTLLRGMAETREPTWKLPAGYQKPSRWVMTSGDLAPVPDDAGTGHSPFASRVLQFLRHSDSPAFGVQDLYVYVRKNLRSEAIAQPIRTPSHMPGGEFVFCRLSKPLNVSSAPTTRTAGVVGIKPVEMIGVKPVARSLEEREYLTDAGGMFRGATFKPMKGGRFEDTGSGVIHDRKLQRNWRMLHQDGTYSWRRAQMVCEEETEGVYRLPTLIELQSLVTKTKRRGDWARIDTEVFPRHAHAARFWTSTKKFMGGVLCVDFLRGSAEATDATEPCGILVISRDKVKE